MLYVVLPMFTSEVYTSNRVRLRVYETSFGLNSNAHGLGSCVCVHARSSSKSCPETRFSPRHPGISSDGLPRSLLLQLFLQRAAIKYQVLVCTALVSPCLSAWGVCSPRAVGNPREGGPSDLRGGVHIPRRMCHLMRCTQIINNFSNELEASLRPLGG